VHEDTYNITDHLGDLGINGFYENERWINRIWGYGLYSNVSRKGLLAVYFEYGNELSGS